jgi:hypothetical protein
MLDELDPDVVPRQQGEHVCVFYRSDGERDRLMAAYLHDGLQIGHTCLCVADAAETAAVLSALQGTDVSKLDLNDHHHTIPSCQVRTPPMTGLIADWSRATFEREDCSFACVVADMSWVLPQPAGDVARYEAIATTLARSYPQSCVCLYDLHRVDDVIYELIRLHTQVWLSGVMLENPYIPGPDGEPNLVPSP